MRIRRFLFLSFFLTVVLLAGAIGGGYAYLRTHLREGPGLLKAKLEQRGIYLTYEKVDLPKTGLSLVLQGVSLSGAPLPYVVKAKKAGVGVSFAIGPSPLKAWLSLSGFDVANNIAYKPSAKEAAGASALPLPMKLAALAVPFLRVDLGLEDGDVSALGFRGVTAQIGAAGFAVDEKGLSRAEVTHAVMLAGLDRAPWLSGIHWRGDSVYSDGLVQTREQELALGPFLMKIAGRFHPKSSKWNAEVVVPEVQLALGAKAVNARALTWLKAISGKLAVKFEAQGIGPDAATANVQGTVLAKGLKMTVEHPIVSGDIEADVDADFTKGQNLSLKALLKADLTGAELKQGDAFTKPKGVPLVVNAALDGSDGKTIVLKGVGTLNNLTVETSGNLIIGNQNIGDLKLHVAPTSLAGWEKFFPRYAEAHTTGTIQGEASYNGPLQDWRMARIDGELKASDVRFPILQSWIPQGDTSVEGLAGVSSDTHVSLVHGVLKTIATTTSIDLKEAKIGKGTVFRKDAGTPLDASVVIASAGKKAEIKKGEFRLGEVTGTLKGSVDDLDAPAASLRAETASFGVTELLKFFPMVAVKEISRLSGNVKVSGTLTSKAEARGEALLSKVNIDYDRIHAEELSGPISFSAGTIAFTLSAKKLELGDRIQDALKKFPALAKLLPDKPSTIAGTFEPGKIAQAKVMWRSALPLLVSGTPGAPSIEIDQKELGARQRQRQARK